MKISSQLRAGMERMATAAIGKADCVPVYAQMSHHSAKLLGESTEKFFTDAETFLKCQINADEFYALDGPTIHYDCYNIEAEALGAKMLWAKDQCPEVDPMHPLLESVDDFKKLKLPNMAKAGRMPFVLEINRRLMDAGLTPKIRFCGLFSLASKLLGFEQTVIACLSNPDGLERLMMFLCDEIVAPWIAYQREQSGYSGTAVGADALASPPMLTPNLTRQFCLQYIQRLEKQLGQIRLAGLWGESLLANPLELLDIKRQGCKDNLQSLDPDVTALGPTYYKEYADQHGMMITMGLDAALICNGPLEAIQARAKKFVAEAGRDGRFILYMNDIPYDTKPEHVHAVVSVAHNHKYS